MLKLWIAAAGLVIAIPAVLLVTLVAWAIGKTRSMRIKRR